MTPWYTPHLEGWFPSAYLDKANVVRLLTEALSADVETVLSDQTSLVGADTAASSLAVAHPKMSFPCSVTTPESSIFPIRPPASFYKGHEATYQARAPFP
jgi:hypothetical protein